MAEQETVGHLSLNFRSWPTPAIHHALLISALHSSLLNLRRYTAHPASSIGQRTAAATASATPMERTTE
jgi:hypothetical protein